MQTSVALDVADEIIVEITRDNELVSVDFILYLVKEINKRGKKDASNKKGIIIRMTCFA